MHCKHKDLVALSYHHITVTRRVALLTSVQTFDTRTLPFLKHLTLTKCKEWSLIREMKAGNHFREKKKKRWILRNILEDKDDFFPRLFLRLLPPPVNSPYHFSPSLPSPLSPPPFLSPPASTHTKNRNYVTDSFDEFFRSQQKNLLNRNLIDFLYQELSGKRKTRQKEYEILYLKSYITDKFN